MDARRTYDLKVVHLFKYIFNLGPRAVIYYRPRGTLIRHWHHSKYNIEHLLRFLPDALHRLSHVRLRVQPGQCWITIRQCRSTDASLHTLAMFLPHSFLHFATIPFFCILLQTVTSSSSSCTSFRWRMNISLKKGVHVEIEDVWPHPARDTGIRHKCKCTVPGIRGRNFWCAAKRITNLRSFWETSMTMLEIYMLDILVNFSAEVGSLFSGQVYDNASLWKRVIG